MVYQSLQIARAALGSHDVTNPRCRAHELDKATVSSLAGLSDHV
jgi:hypothetical protein